MKLAMTRFLLGLGVIVAVTWGLTAAAQDKAPAGPDLSKFKTVETAATTRISKSASTSTGVSGYLGVHVTLAKGGKLVVDDVESDSPAAKAGLEPGDIVTKLEGKAVKKAEVFRELLQSKGPGDAVKLAVLRKDKTLDISATLGAVSKPMKLSTQRAVMGVQVGEVKDGEGVPITRITSGSPAEKAGLKTGEILSMIDGMALTTQNKINDVLSERKPGDIVTLIVRREDKDVQVKVELTSEQSMDPRGMNWDNRNLTPFKRDIYRLGVVCIEYPDVKHNAKITNKDWEESLFSKGKYNNKSVTGQTVYGSMNDYYQEQSYGYLKVTGKVFDWVEVGKKRMDYAQATGNTKTALLTEAMDKVLARDGKDAFKDLDGVYFMYAGDRVQTNRGGLYWPHRATVTHQNKRWAYFIVPEGGSRMTNISVICHEFGHMLGLPDLYARPENPGSEGVGTWCAMSNQVNNGRPQHFSAWCKEQLGWVKPCVIDPTVKQKLILSPIEDSDKECFKILVKPDGSEYFLLENRRKKGFDTDLPGEGLLIWRVVANRPILEESHGVDGPSGPRVYLGSVPFPSSANTAFTPFTTPSSRSQLGGGYPVHITNIRRLSDGKITFYVGYEYQ